MEMLNIQQVVVGSEMMTSPASVIKSEPVDKPSLDPYQHESSQCFHCLITFRNPKAKERHMRKNHREEFKMSLQQTDTIFGCYICDRAFPSSEKLTEHHATHGNDDRPFRCTLCEASFRNYGELTQHRRKKCAEKQFTCKDCGSVFRIASNLRTHAIAMHCEEPKKRGRPAKPLAERAAAASRKDKRAGEGGAEEEQDAVEEWQEEYEEELADSPGKETDQQELKIPCPEDDCDLVFPSITALRAHKRERHLPKQLKTSAAHGQHSDQHCCPTCRKTFSRESNLNAHLKTHIKAEEEGHHGKR